MNNSSPDTHPILHTDLYSSVLHKCNESGVRDESDSDEEEDYNMDDYNFDDLGEKNEEYNKNDEDCAKNSGDEDTYYLTGWK